MNGIDDVVRNGITNRGYKFKLAYFQPETNLNPEDRRLYEMNILNETRQLKYSIQNENSIDIVLLLNGIPLIALELKNQITGQSSENAQKQFMYDRNPRELIFKFNSRIIVYFAVDHYDVKMTTKLAGPNTRYLPFKVVTDRTVLDKQLQDTIYQFEHQRGVVVKIDDEKTSQDLKNAINDGKRIIITTLQKFPVIYKDVSDTAGKKFAVIVDEAHSSQTGNSAKKLKIALADRDEALKKYAELEAIAEENEKDYEDKIVEELATHGKQDNLSFFAFTATPKGKTLELLGTKQEDGTFRPYHIYSMRRAIEEEFILDVLVAFSGEVKDGADSFTEAGMNKTKDGKKIKESQTKEYFHGDEFNVLVVAEKYQTGFDESLLHTMFVDKKLSGIKAVQTLSRLNRMCKGKDDTLVIDFVNKAEEIQEAFKPFYDVSVLERETDPNVIYDKLNILRSYRLWYDDNVEKFCKMYLKNGKQNENDFGKLTSCVKETVDLYNKLDIEQRESFRREVKVLIDFTLI